jgi:hypothetical protein
MGMRDLDELFAALAGSKFRSRIALSVKDRAYLQSKGLEVVMRHGEDFVRQRLAPARPRNDGKQTPWRGHPIFAAQHATGTCCRSCLLKWHGIPKGLALSDAEIDYVLAVLKGWLQRQV